MRASTERSTRKPCYPRRLKATPQSSGAMQSRRRLLPTRPRNFLLAPICALAQCAFAQGVQSAPSILDPHSTPAHEIYRLSLFVLLITGSIFVVVAGLLAYVVIRFRARETDKDHEPPQIYGSTQVELAWTVIPVLIVVVLFLTTARIIFAIQDAPEPKTALDVTVIGHQFWWEFRYPALGVATANELYVPVSDGNHPTPTFIKLLSADTDHSFWVPRLAGKTDLIPNHPNSIWIDPHETGVYLGQCAQYCGTQHAKMLLRVYVQSREDFERWIREQRQPAVVADAVDRKSVV